MEMKKQDPSSFATSGCFVSMESGDVQRIRCDAGTQKVVLGTTGVTFAAICCCCQAVSSDAALRGRTKRQTVAFSDSLANTLPDTQILHTPRSA